MTSTTIYIANYLDNTGATAINIAKNGSDSLPKAQNQTARKLGNKEQRELDGLPASITALEQEQAAIQRELADGGVYTRDPGRAKEMAKRDTAIEEELHAALTRWEALSSLSAV